MKRNLTFKETVTITSMLFGMFFGAGNLIFPAKMGIDAGSNLWSAFLGVFITAVGIPMLAVVALGLSRCEGVVPLAGKVGKKYSVFFCTLLYLTIGPLFAIPRCASTSFSVGAAGLIAGGNEQVNLAVFSFVFFALVLFFSLKPGGIMTWIGKILNPVFLVFLFVLVIAALVNPVTSFSQVVPAESYAAPGSAFFTGFLEGYNTLDALAGLAFGIVVIQVVRSHGVEEPGRVAVNTAKAGVFSCLFMGIIYFFITLITAQSAPLCAEAVNGGQVLGILSRYYFSRAGAVLTAAIVTFACLKTAIGQLLRGLCADVPQGAGLLLLGCSLLPDLLRHCQFRPEHHRGLVRAGADVCVSPGHHADPAGADGEMVRQGSCGLRRHHRLHPGRRCSGFPGHPVRHDPGQFLPHRRDGIRREIHPPLQAGHGLGRPRSPGLRPGPGAQSLSA